MKKYAVIGNPIDHSLSPQIHKAFAEQHSIDLEYTKIKSDADSFEEDVSNFIANGGKGLNVTLPFKKLAANISDDSSSQVQQCGAANTLAVDSAGAITAHNTDGSGLIRDLSRLDIPLKNKAVLLLGAGGAAYTIMPALLATTPALLTVCNKTLNNAFTLVEHFGQELEGRLIATGEAKLVAGHFDLVIDATSFSLDDSGAQNNFFAESVTLADTLYTLSYRKGGEPKAVTYAKKLGLTAHDGLGMLVEQAADSFSIWHGVRPETSTVLTHLRSL